MRTDPHPPASFSALRRVGIGLNVLTAVTALLALVIMANYLAARHFRRFQWTGEGAWHLSVPTRQVLGAVTNQVKVTILFDRSDPLFAPVSALLKEYAQACPRLLVDHVDHKRDLGRAQLVMSTYQLPQEEANLVVFDSNSRFRVVRSSELSDYDWTGLFTEAKEVRRVAFEGERLFTGAIAGLLESRSPTACFLQGHREHDPGSDDPLMGYAKLAKLLQQKNITVTRLKLLGDSAIPDDCQLLVIAGPQDALDPAESEKINRYLGQGGRLLALLSQARMRGNPSGLERLLANWGVAVGSDYVFDPKNTRTGSDLICTNFAPHPITRSLRESSLYFFLPRSVGPLPGAAPSGDAPKVQTLISTSGAGYTANEIAADGTPKANPFRDRRGVIPLAVAVEKGSIQGVSADRGSTRMVIAGESVFLGNQTIENLANRDFAVLAINWLLDRPQYLTGIAPRPIREYHITLSRTEMTHLRWILLGAFPGAVLLLGLLVWMRRRA